MSRVFFIFFLILDLSSVAACEYTKEEEDIPEETRRFYSQVLEFPSSDTVEKEMKRFLGYLLTPEEEQAIIKFTGSSFVSSFLERTDLPNRIGDGRKARGFWLVLSLNISINAYSNDLKEKGLAPEIADQIGYRIYEKGPELIQAILNPRISKL